MRINHKVLSIPPYVSTSWKNIAALQSKQEGDKHTLTVHLQDGSCVQIPGLESIIMEAIFVAHAKSMENENKPGSDAEPKKRKAPVQDKPSNIKFFEIENINSIMNHNEEERNAADLPPYILDKVKQVSEEMGLSNSATLPQAEANCNCPFCQIARSIPKTETSLTSKVYLEEEEEIITAKDLSFTSWIIHPIKPNLYRVAHADQPQEEYQVFLESPIGCTCGSNQCEHIRAVLSS